MKRKKMSLLCFMSNINAWQYISFDEAMKKNQFPRAIPKTQSIVEIDGQILYDFFKDLYELNNLSVIEVCVARIPKIIHQIWLGSPVPESFIALQESWIEYHLGREWRYKL